MWFFWPSVNKFIQAFRGSDLGYGTYVSSEDNGEGKVGGLVEDCASAWAVSGVYAGIALMGTSLPDSYIPILQKLEMIHRKTGKKTYEIISGSNLKKYNRFMNYVNKYRNDVQNKKRFKCILVGK